MNATVIGGGIVGLASAYYLSETDMNVTLCEKNTLGAGSSKRGNGGIRTQFSKISNIELSKESMDVWSNFESLFGIDINFRKNGYLLITTSDSVADELEQNIKIQNQRGISTKYVSPDDISDYSPEIYTEDLVAGAYSSTDGFADPQLALQGFARGVKNSGVDIRTETEVTSIMKRDNGYRIQTSDESFESEYVINAAGAWSDRIGSFVDIELPLHRIRRQIVTVDTKKSFSNSHPYTRHIDQSITYRPESKNVAVVSGDPQSNAAIVTDPERYKENYDQEFATEALKALDQVADYFDEGSNVNDGWAGLYTVTPDYNPIIEESLPGFITVAGFSGHGFMHSPAVGKLVREVVISGEVSIVDIDDFSRERFDNGESTEERIVL